MKQRDPTCGQVNAGELARIFGVSRKWVHELTKLGLPRAGRLYDVAAAVQWHTARITERSSDEPQDIMEARRLLYIEQAAKCRLESDRLRGTVVSLDEARATLMEIGSIVASQLDSVAPRLAGLVAGETDQKHIQALLFEEHRSIRESIAEAIMGFERDSGFDHPASPDEDGGPVGGHQADPPAGEPGAGALAD